MQNYIYSIPWFAWIPIMGILCGVVGTICATIQSMARRSQIHAERMAMIQAGMHPDFPHPAADMVGKPYMPEEV